MMKIILTSFLCILTVPNNFYEKVLDDLPHGYFVAISIKSVNYNGRAVIKNGDLCYFLHKTKGYDKDAFKSFVERLLLTRDSLDLGDVNFAKWGFEKAPSVPDVDRIALEGQNLFLDHYFDGRVLRERLSKAERIAVIAKLFDWEIPSWINDHSGYVTISR